MRINPYKTQLGSFLPNGIMELSTIGSTAKLVYGRLCQFAGEKGYCWPAISTLAVAIGCSKTTVKKAIHELLDCHLIEVEHRYSENGDATSNLYFFLDHDALHIHPFGGGQDSDPPQSVSVPPRSVTVPKENHLRETKNLKSSSSKQAKVNSAAAAQYSDSSTIPFEIEAAILRLNLGQAHLNQVRKLISEKLKSGIDEAEALSCLIVFNDRLPMLQNKKYPCSLLASLFNKDVGTEHLEFMNDEAAKIEAAAQEKTLREAIYTATQLKLTQDATEWVNSIEGLKFLEMMSS